MGQVQRGEQSAVLLAREPAPVLDGWVIAEDIAYAWPLTGAERRAVRFARAPVQAP